MLPTLQHLLQPITTSIANELESQGYKLSIEDLIPSGDSCGINNSIELRTLRNIKIATSQLTELLTTTQLPIELQISAENNGNITYQHSNHKSVLIGQVLDELHMTVNDPNNNNNNSTSPKLPSFDLPPEAMATLKSPQHLLNPRNSIDDVIAASSSTTTPQQQQPQFLPTTSAITLTSQQIDQVNTLHEYKPNLALITSNKIRMIILHLLETFFEYFHYVKNQRNTQCSQSTSNIVDFDLLVNPTYRNLFNTTTNSSSSGSQSEPLVVSGNTSSSLSSHHNNHHNQITTTTNNTKYDHQHVDQTFLWQQFNVLADHLSGSHPSYGNFEGIDVQCLSMNYRQFALLYMLLTNHKVIPYSTTNDTNKAMGSNNNINNNSKNNNTFFSSIITIQEMDEKYYLTFFGPLLAYCGYFSCFKSKLIDPPCSSNAIPQKCGGIACNSILQTTPPEKMMNCDGPAIFSLYQLHGTEYCVLLPGFSQIGLSAYITLPTTSEYETEHSNNNNNNNNNSLQQQHLQKSAQKHVLITTTHLKADKTERGEIVREMQVMNMLCYIKYRVIRFFQQYYITQQQNSQFASQIVTTGSNGSNSGSNNNNTGGEYSHNNNNNNNQQQQPIDIVLYTLLSGDFNATPYTTNTAKYQSLAYNVMKKSKLNFQHNVVHSLGGQTAGGGLLNGAQPQYDLLLTCNSSTTPIASHRGGLSRVGSAKDLLLAEINQNTTTNTSSSSSNNINDKPIITPVTTATIGISPLDEIGINTATSATTFGDINNGNMSNNNNVVFNSPTKYNIGKYYIMILDNKYNHLHFHSAYSYYTRLFKSYINNIKKNNNNDEKQQDDDNTKIINNNNVQCATSIPGEEEHPIFKVEPAVEHIIPPPQQDEDNNDEDDDNENQYSNNKPIVLNEAPYTTMKTRNNKLTKHTIDYIFYTRHPIVATRHPGSDFINNNNNSNNNTNNNILQESHNLDDTGKKIHHYHHPHNHSPLQQIPENNTTTNNNNNNNSIVESHHQNYYKLNLLAIGTIPHSTKVFPKCGLPDWTMPSDHLPLFALFKY